MSAIHTLQELTRQVRGKTLEYLDAAEPGWLTWAPPGTSNHMIWHAGHGLWVQDALCIKLLTGSSELPPDWARKFGMDCDPVALTTEWPGRAELRCMLVDQQERLLEVLGKTDEDTLLGPSPKEDRFATTAGWIIHGLHDEAKHHGEIYLLLKLLRANRGVAGPSGAN